MRGENKLGMFKGQQEDREPGVEPETGRVAGEGARKVAGFRSWRALRAMLGL